MLSYVTNIILIVMIFSQVKCDEDDADEDTSLVKLLANQNINQVNTEPHVKEIESNINGGGTVGDEMPAQMQSYTTNEQHTPSLRLMNLTQPESFTAKYRDGTQNGEGEIENANAQKREEERFEETVGNPNPRPEYFQHTADEMELSRGDKISLMEEGDGEKDNSETETWKEFKMNDSDKYIYNTDDNAQNKHEVTTSNSHNNLKETPTVPQIDETSRGNDTQDTLNVKNYFDSKPANDISSTSTEEDQLSDRIKFLKQKLREKTSQSHLLHHKGYSMLHNLTSPTRTEPKTKYVMQLMKNPPNMAAAVVDLQTSKPTSDLVLRNLTNTVMGTKPHKELFAFSYDPLSPFGPQSWQTLNPEWTCNGRKQSPINIDNRYIMDNDIVKNAMLKIIPANSAITGIIKNNGHAPTLTLSNDISLKLFGGTLMNDYYLKQMHFHFGCDSLSGSEHQIDGVTYPLEIHLVFWDNSTFVSFPDAAKADRGIAVLAVLYQLEAIPYGEVKNTPLAQMVQMLHRIEEEGDELPITEEFNFRLEKLIPNVIDHEHIDRFFIYEGSLSTPGCYESVTWIVFETHPPVTESQIRTFRKLKSTKVSLGNKMCNNFRPLQKKNGRRIYSNIV